MFNKFFKKEKKEDSHTNDILSIALLIHAAKIDENYSDQEEKVIKKTLLELGTKKENLENIMINAKKIEDNANQILDFTREIKNMNQENKIKIVESLWQIIYSNQEADMYEAGLMRKLAGLLYIDNKTMGDIKERIKKENK